MSIPALLPPRYPLDYTGSAITNLVTNEPHTLSAGSRGRVIAPTNGPFFLSSMVVTDVDTNETLASTQWMPTNIVQLPTAKAGLGEQVFDNLVILDQGVSDNITITYQTVGGHFAQSLHTAQRLLQELWKDTRPAHWPRITDKPEFFEPAPHFEYPDDLFGFEYLVVQLERLRQTILMSDSVHDDAILAYVDERAEYLKGIIESLVAEGSSFHQHVNATGNVHVLTAAMVKLGNVRNYPLATEEEALEGVLPNRYMTPTLVEIFMRGQTAAHVSGTRNPHGLTKADVDLPLVQNYGVAQQIDFDNPQVGDPKYVVNTIFKSWLDNFLNTFTQTLLDQIQQIGNQVQQAYTAAQEAATRASQDITSAVTGAASAAQNASTALNLAQQCNANVAASELLARNLLLVYKDSYAVLNWVRGAITQALGWADVVYGQGRFVAVAAGTTDRYAHSLDGITWTSGTLPEAGNWRCIAYGNGKFVMVSAASNVVLHSDNGLAWTKALLPTVLNWSDVCYGNGRFVAIAYGNQAAVSTDGGLSWTMANLPMVGDWVSLTYGAGRFAAVARSSADAAYSADGSAWTAATLPLQREWTSVVYGNGRYNAIAANSVDQATSLNGADWTVNQGVADMALNWQSMVYGDGKFFALANGSSRAMMSLDGLKWEERTLLDNQQWISCAYGANKFIGLAKDSLVTARSQPLPAV